MPAVATSDPSVDINSSVTKEKSISLHSMSSPPSLHASSRWKAKMQTLQQNNNPPSREKVTAAIALVRARQGTIMGPPDETTESQTGSGFTATLSSTVSDSRTAPVTQSNSD